MLQRAAGLHVTLGAEETADHRRTDGGDHSRRRIGLLVIRAGATGAAGELGTDRAAGDQSRGRTGAAGDQSWGRTGLLVIRAGDGPELLVIRAGAGPGLLVIRAGDGPGLLVIRAGDGPDCW